MFDNDEGEDVWAGFEGRLREAFDQRDGIDFEITLMRMRGRVLDDPGFARVIGSHRQGAAP